MEGQVNPPEHLSYTRHPFEDGEEGEEGSVIRPDFSTAVFVFVTVYGLSENC